MKKLLVLVLSIMMVAGSFTAIYASDGGMDSVRSAMEGSKVIIGGDARVRGVCKINHDTDDDNDDDNCYWDQRVRLKVTAQIAGGVEVRTRVKIGDGMWDGATQTGTDVVTDYAYIHLPVGPVFVDAGRQPYNWGNKFLVWDARRDRLAVHGHMDDITFSVYADKVVESNGNEGFLDNDVDTYGVEVVYSAGDMEAGGTANYLRNEVIDDVDGYILDAYFSAMVSGVGVKAEVAYLDEQFNTVSGEEDSPWGIFGSASMGVQDGLTAGLLVAYSQNTFSADDHFTPTVFIGTDQPTAMSDFGDLGDSLLIVGSVDFDATPEASVYGKVAYADYEAYPDGDDASAWEIDAGLSYDVATNTTYSVDAGYLIPDDFSAEDDGAFSVINKLQVYF